jgi:hypothetical protein
MVPRPVGTELAGMIRTATRILIIPRVVFPLMKRAGLGSVGVMCELTLALHTSELLFRFCGVESCENILETIRDGDGDILLQESFQPLVILLHRICDIRAQLLHHCVVHDQMLLLSKLFHEFPIVHDGIHAASMGLHEGLRGHIVLVDRHIAQEKSLELAALVYLQTHKQVTAARIDAVRALGKFIPIRETELPRDDALLPVRCNQGCSVFQHLYHAVDHLPCAGHDLHFLEYGKVAEHERDSLEEVITFEVDLLSAGFDVDDDF